MEGRGRAVINSLVCSGWPSDVPCSPHSSSTSSSHLLSHNPYCRSQLYNCYYSLLLLMTVAGDCSHFVAVLCYSFIRIEIEDNNENEV